MARDKGTGSVYQRKDGRWIGSLEAGWTAKGTRRRITVSATTKREALVKLRDKAREIARSGIPDENARRATTIKAYSDEWLESTQQHVAPSTWATNKSAVNRWIIPTIGHRRLEQVSAKDIRAVTNALLKNDPPLAAQARRTHSILTKMLADAARDGHSVPQSVFHVRTLGKSKVERGPIPLAQIYTLLETAKTLPDYSRWLAAFFAGIRPAEARGLTWDRVNFDLGVLEVSWQLKSLPYKVPRDRTSGFRVPLAHESLHIVDAYHLVRPKTDAGDRWIPMTKDLSAALRVWRENCPPGHNLVWPRLAAHNPAHIGRPRSDKDDLKAWRDLCDQAEVYKDDGSHYDLYSARHSTASILRDNGATDEQIMAVMGHSSILSSKAYITPSDAGIRRVLESIGESVREAKPKVIEP